MAMTIANAPSFNHVNVKILRNTRWDLLILNRRRRPSRRNTIDSRPPRSILKRRATVAQASEPPKRVRFEPTNEKKITDYFRVGSSRSVNESVVRELFPTENTVVDVINVRFSQNLIANL